MFSFGSIYQDVIASVLQAVKSPMHPVHETLATIPNRYIFIDAIEKYARMQGAISLMLVDVVRFSDVTTSLGMVVGDRFLLDIANRIGELFPEAKQIGRISGDVFGVVFSGKLSRQQMSHKFEWLVDHFKTPMQHQRHSFIADFNVGFVASSAQLFDLTTFVSRAEAALKQAKENKYENLCVLSVEEKAPTGRSLTLKADLTRALERGELELYFQPQVDLNTLEITAAECLLRWNHPLDGVLFPGPLIEAAESYNMMNELAYWTFEEAFKSLRMLGSQGIDIRLAINMSPTQLYDSKLIGTLLQLRDKYQVALDKIELELTEDVALSNSLMVKKQLSQLRHLGMTISVDDFGKGYSNLAYIRELELNALKIDKTFVMQLNQSPVNRAIIEGVQLIGKAKGCDVIAEGIETVEQLHLLREVGVSVGQGFLFSPAVPMAQFMTLAQSDLSIGESPLRKQLMGA